MNFSKYTQKAIYIAKEAGNLLMEGFRGDLEIEYKGQIDLVTEMDKKSEDFITKALRESFPGHNVVAEEGTEIDNKSEFAWYIDPLDGTTNYAHRLPWFAVSIALFKSGKPFAGVIYNPAIDEIFYAEKDLGAYVNGKKMKVSQTGQLETSLLVTGFPYYVWEKPERVVANFKTFLVRTQGIRRYGAAALDLAYIAAGRYDGFWEENLKPWDTAAGILMVTEAGGRVTNYLGEEYSIFGDTIVAANNIIHEQIVRNLVY